MQRNHPLLLLHDVARMQRTRFDQWARTYGLTRAQGVILLRLAGQPGISQIDMASLCEVEPITIGRLVDRLEARGLIERRPDPSDRRLRRLHLLPAAQPMLEKIEAYRDSLMDMLSAGLEPGALDTMVQVLLHMKDKLAQEAQPGAAAAGRQ